MDATAVVFGRNYRVLSAPYDVATAMPANTIAWGASWGGAFVDRGYTSGGMTINLGVTRGEIRVDQEFDPIARPVTARNIQFTTTLAEFTPANLQLASNLGELTTVVSGASTHGNVDLDLTSELSDTYFAWGFDIQQQDAQPFRALIYRGLAVGNPQPRFEPSSLAGVALDIAALVDTATSPSRIAKFRDVLPFSAEKEHQWLVKHRPGP